MQDAYLALLAAMREGDTAALDALLADGFTLTHIGGYEQPKSEWLAQLGDGQFVYHRIDERDTDIAVTGSTARVDGRTLIDAIVYGARAEWRLRLTLSYAFRGGRWTALRAVATTW